MRTLTAINWKKNNAKIRAVPSDRRGLPYLNRAGIGFCGFTLVELCVVVAIIAAIVAIAFPQMLPVIAFSNHEGAARQLAGFGRSAMSECIMRHEEFIVRIDLDNQEYWAMHWPIIEEDEELPTEVKRGRVSRMGRSEEIDTDQESRFAFEVDEELQATVDNGLADPRKQAREMRRRFEQMAQAATTSRANNVKRSGILQDVGPLFDEEFSLGVDIESDEELLEEVTLPLLLRTPLPDDVMIETVMVGGQEYSSGLVEITITPFGLSQPVVFYVKDAGDDYYTVTWDAITGGAHLESGRQSEL